MDLGHVLGTDGQEWYNVWSGIGADLGQIALFGAAIGLYRKHRCHVQGYWRLAKLPVEGTSWYVCHKHHPEGHPTAEDVTRAHAQARGSASAGST